MTQEQTPFAGWAVVELMGHQMVAGYVTEETVFGAAMCRVDVPAIGEMPAWTKFYGAGAIYAVTPTTEDTVRAVADRINTRPISPFLLPSPEPEQRCRVCGCTEDNACWPADASGPCHWVEPDLCSACVGAEAPIEG